MVFDMRADDTPAPLRGAYSNLGSIRIGTPSVNGEIGFHSANCANFGDFRVLN
jgi:hypothetical protein